MKAYQSDLAFIHDHGFSGLSLQAASVLPVWLRKHHIPGKRIVELGCGSGRLAGALMRRGFSVSGIDCSRAMVRLAKEHCPRGRFRVGSIWSCPIPPADAVISVGEVLNYQFDGQVNNLRLRKLFKRIYASLAPSGVFIFDFLSERRSGKTILSRKYVEGDGWLVAVEKLDSPQRVVRRIISFRDTGGLYRRSVEVHRVRRYSLPQVRTCLRGVGFRVSILNGYGDHLLEAGHTILLAVRSRWT